MARSSEHHVGRTYEVMKGLVAHCFINDGSVLSADRSIWTLDNLREAQRRFMGDGAIAAGEDREGERLSFDDKLRIQFLGNPGNRKLSDDYRVPAAASADVRRLMSEVLLVHVAILSDSTIGIRKKGALVNLLTDNLCEDPSALFGEGILHPGQGFMKSPRDVESILKLAIAFKSNAASIQWPRDESKFEAVLAAIDRADVAADMTERARHAVWHLVFPDWFEPCVSKDHRAQIRDAFAGFLDPAAAPPAVEGPYARLDWELSAIRSALESQPWAAGFRRSGGGGADRPAAPVIDFYSPRILELWAHDSTRLLSILRLKRQVVLYGPPGTSKSYAARELAVALLLDEERERVSAQSGKADAIRHLLERGAELRERWFAPGAGRRVHRMQLHPAYSYENFIGGHLIGDGGRVVWERGSFLRLLDRMREAPGAHVLILDEINRTDLSRLFGEAFSALEDRDAAFEIPGTSSETREGPDPAVGSSADGPNTLAIPKNLYIIGTMNEIDHSLEQVDFALRRRFAWHRCDFDGEQLARRLREIVHALPREQMRSRWRDREDEEIDVLVARAAELNDAIEKSDRLGHRFAIGHTYYFVLPDLLVTQSEERSEFLFRKSRAAPPLERLWSLALLPLLEAYMAGVEPDETRRFIQECEARFLRGLE